jgi:hypothetical protein
MGLLKRDFNGSTKSLCMIDLRFRRDTPMPEIKANEVLVKVKAASVNPIDWYQIA